MSKKKKLTYGTLKIKHLVTYKKTRKHLAEHILCVKSEDNYLDLPLE